MAVHIVYEYNTLRGGPFFTACNLEKVGAGALQVDAILREMHMGNYSIKIFRRA